MLIFSWKIQKRNNNSQKAVKCILTLNGVCHIVLRYKFMFDFSRFNTVLLIFHQEPLHKNFKTWACVVHESHTMTKRVLKKSKVNDSANKVRSIFRLIYTPYNVITAKNQLPRSKGSEVEKISKRRDTTHTKYIWFLLKVTHMLL